MTVLQMRRQAVFRVSSLVLCAAQFLLSLSGCSMPSSPDLSERLSGEELYRGMYFGQGDITSKVPELRDALSWRATLDESQRITLDRFVDKLVVAIRQTDTGFFEAFASALQSGDHVRIGRMLEQTDRVTLAALDRVPEVANWRAKLAENREAVQAELIRKYDEGHLSKDALQAAQSRMEVMLASKGEVSSSEARKIEPGWDFAVVIAIAAVIVYPPALAVALAIVYAYAFVTGPAGGSGTLTRDRVIDALATRLVVAPQGQH